jgi:hypothetical protein
VKNALDSDVFTRGTPLHRQFTTSLNSKNDALSLLDTSLALSALLLACFDAALCKLFCENVDGI